MITFLNNINSLVI